MSTETTNVKGQRDETTTSYNSDSLKTLMLGLGFLLFSILLYLPAKIYLSNVNEFSLEILDLLAIFVPAISVSALGAASVILLLPNLLRKHLIALCFAVGLLFWLQGSILVWNYGPLDGSEIQWELYSQNGIIDSLVWLLILALALWKPANLIKICRPVAIFVMSVQFCTLLYLSSASQLTGNEANVRNFVIDGAPKYSFSKDRNVILIVLDAYQSDIFFEIISESPEYLGLFEGFTYYRDAVAGSNYTELAIPALLTGRVFDNSEPREDFLRDAFLTSGITANLKREGFVVDIYPWIGWGNESIYFDSAIASNLTKVDRKEVDEPVFSEKKAKEALHLLDLSLFRAVPHYLKYYIYNDQEWLASYIATYLLPEGIKQVVSTDSEFEAHTFVRNAPETLPIDRGDRVFKYYHLKGAHSPLTVNESLEFTDEVFAFNRARYIYQAKANLLAMSAFFGKLKRANIYDKSLIIIVGDHGSGESSELYIEPPGALREPYRLEGTKRNFRRDKARAIPLVLIKRFGSTGQLETSSSPVSLTDIPATIFSELGLEKKNDRPSMFEIDSNSTRRRYHSAFEFSPNKTGHVDDITVYEISGDSWINDSWVVDQIQKPSSQGAPE